MTAYTPASINTLALLAKDNSALLASSAPDLKALVWQYAPGDQNLVQSYLQDANGFKTKAVFHILGVVDNEQSKLGDYGSLFVPREGTPTLAALKKAKFHMALTHPTLRDDPKESVHYSELIGQWEHLDTIKQSGEDFCIANELTNIKKENTWTRILTVNSLHGEESTRGWIQVCLGNVYLPMKLSASTNALKSASPKKSKVNASGDNGDALSVRDPKNFISVLPEAQAATFKPNDKLQIFDSNGVKVKGDSESIQSVFADARWVELQVQPVMWILRDGAEITRTFQLQLVKATALANDSPTAPSMAVFHSGGGSLNRLLGSAQTSGIRGAVLSAASTSQSPASGSTPSPDDGKTLSDNSEDKNVIKRKHDDVDGEPNAKRAKLTK